MCELKAIGFATVPSCCERERPEPPVVDMSDIDDVSCCWGAPPSTVLSIVGTKVSSTLALAADPTCGLTTGFTFTKV